MAQQGGLDLGIGSDGGLQVGSCLIYGRADEGVEPADLPRHRLRLDRGPDRSATGVAEHHDGLGAKDRDAVFEAGDDRRGGDIAGDTRDEQMPDALIEYQLDRHARIRTGQHGGKRLLLFHCLRLQHLQIFLKGRQTTFGEAPVALDHLLQRRVGAQ